MNASWKHLLDQCLDGDRLTAEELAALKEALRAPENRQEAAAQAHFHEALARHVSPPAAALPASRRRLLAKVGLREQRLLHAGARASARRARRLWTAVAVAGATATSLLIAIIAVTVGGGGPEQITLTGDAEVFRNGKWIGRENIRRGDAVIAGGDGAALQLGGYCQLRLEPGCELVVAGSRRDEHVHLRRGSLTNKITPGVGRYVCGVPLGIVRVVGAEFTVRVDVPPKAEGEEAMKRFARIVVMVAAGTVGYDIAGETGQLSAGDGRAFAAPPRGQREESSANTTTGVVEKVTDLSVQIENKNGHQVFMADRANKTALLDLGALVRDDQITVTWEEEFGKKWIMKIEGRGAIRGKVTDKGEQWIEVTPGPNSAGEIMPQKLGPKWVGGMPRDGGGPDKEIVRKIQETPIGATVELTWELAERKRVVGIDVIEE